MAASITVIGSGPSGAHFAKTLLERGHEVTMLDIGREPDEPLLPDASLLELKDRLEDPGRYFIGNDGSGIVFPSEDGEVYGFPPGKRYIFDEPEGFEVRTSGFEPLFGYARGGMAEAWTAGCYPYDEAELAAIGLPAEAMHRAYGRIAERIGVTGERDDLTGFLPEHDGLLDPLPLDAHSAQIMSVYARKRARLRKMNDGLGVFLGRTRVATLSRAHGGRPACTRLGRCLWGCPTGALYTPSATLDACMTDPRFRYVAGVRALYLETDHDGKVIRVHARRESDGSAYSEPVERVALAAGALASTEIVLRTLARNGQPRPELRGLMDNRQVLLPFVNLRRIGAPYEPDSYQYHLLGMGLADADPTKYVHCQVTTLGTALMHPIVQKLPFDLATSWRIGAALHGALGLVNVNFCDDRRETNRVRLEGGQSEGSGALCIDYSPAAGESARLTKTLRVIRAALTTLGCVVPPGMAHVRPMGASVHYTGTLPISTHDEPLTTEPSGKLRGFSNLWVVDGASFGFLPAKNVTFTLMANAHRIAESAF